MHSRFLVKAPVDTALGDDALVDQNPLRELNGRRRIAIVDVVLLEMPRSDISRLSGVYFLKPALFDAIRREGLTGLVPRDFTMSFDPQMQQLGAFDGRSLPELSCVEVSGDVSTDDFSHVEGCAGLVVSSQALAILQRFDLTAVVITPFA